MLPCLILHWHKKPELLALCSSHWSQVLVSYVHNQCVLVVWSVPVSGFSKHDSIVNYSLSFSISWSISLSVITVR